MKQKVFSTLGASSHSKDEREKDDFYRTDPIAAECLIRLMGDELPQNIWECACGDGALAEVFKKHGYQVKATDLINRGYGVAGVDFLTNDEKFSGAIITNPPFKHAESFVRQALEKVHTGDYVCLFLRTLFLEGKARKKLFEQYPPKQVLVSSSRINCSKPSYKGTSSAMSFSWFIWQKGYQGETVVKWFDRG